MSECNKRSVFRQIPRCWKTRAYILQENESRQPQAKQLLQKSRREYIEKLWQESKITRTRCSKAKSEEGMDSKMFWGRHSQTESNSAAVSPAQSGSVLLLQVQLEFFLLFCLEGVVATFVFGFVLIALHTLQLAIGTKATSDSKIVLVRKAAIKGKWVIQEQAGQF